MAKPIHSGVATCNVEWSALRLKLWCAVMTAVLCGGMFGVKSVSAQFCEYEITAVVPGPDCGLFGNAPVQFLGINDYGQACGFVRECAAGSGTWPVIWSEETGLVILPLPDGANNGEAVDINNVLGSDGLGQVACEIGAPGVSDVDGSYIYDDGRWFKLAEIPEHFSSDPAAINDCTTTVGESSGKTTIAVKWEGVAIHQFELPEGPNSLATDINERTSVSGRMGHGLSTFALGFLLTTEGAEAIPPVPGGNSSHANAVNSSDLVVGESFIPVKSGLVPRRAWRYANGVLYEFPNPDNAIRTRAMDVNDAGQILIVTSNPASSFFWQNGNMVRMSDLFEPIEGVGFNGGLGALNNLGQFAGTGTSQGALGVILTPIDRPLGDVNIDCAVDMHDLIAVLEDWGQCPERGSCLCDIVTSSNFQPPGDGRVDGADLAVVLGNWSPAGSESRNTWK